MSDYQIIFPSDAYGKLADIAARLGVDPLPEDSVGPIAVLVTARGRQYDLFAVIGAFLDRVDAISQMMDDKAGP